MQESVLDQLLREVRELRERLDERSPLPAVLPLTRAAQELSVSVKKLRGMIDRAEILACEIGRVRMIPRSEIERLTTPQAPVPGPRRPRGAARRSSPRAEAAKLREALKRGQ